MEFKKARPMSALLKQECKKFDIQFDYYKKLTADYFFDVLF